MTGKASHFQCTTPCWNERIFYPLLVSVTGIWMFPPPVTVFPPFESLRVDQSFSSDVLWLVKNALSWKVIKLKFICWTNALECTSLQMNGREILRIYWTQTNSEDESRLNCFYLVLTIPENIFVQNQLIFLSIKSNTPDCPWCVIVR